MLKVANEAVFVVGDEKTRRSKTMDKALAEAVKAA